jgi:uncharacterized protein (TIGR03435 family)
MSVLLRAYDVQSYQVTGPDWLSTRRYEIVATLPTGTTADQFRAMLRNLLAERFALAVHHVKRDFQGYDLVAVKKASKLTPSAAASAAAPETPPGVPRQDADGYPRLDGPGLAMMEGIRGRSVVSYLTARAQPLSALVNLLAREFRLPIADRTGLTGLFDFRLEFAPQPPGALPNASPERPLDASDDSAPNLITAVREQLGLKLNPVKIPLDVLIVDRANPEPAGN